MGAEKRLASLERTGDLKLGRRHDDEERELERLEFYTIKEEAT